MYYDKYQAKMLSFKQKHDPYQAKICLEVGKYASSFSQAPSACGVQCSTERLVGLSFYQCAVITYQNVATNH